MQSEPATSALGPPLSRAPRTLRGMLRLLLIAPLVPLLAISGLLVWSQWQSHRDDVFANLEQSATIVAAAVDQELEIGRAILETLAVSELIDRQDWAGFHRLASAAIQAHPDTWISLGSPSGVQPVRTIEAPGTPSTVNPNALAREGAQIDWNGHTLPVSTQGLGERVFRTAATANTGLYFGTIIRRPAVAIAVPVMRREQVTHVLIMGYAPDRLARLIQGAGSAEQRAALVDASGRIIASSRDPAQGIGLMVSPGLRTQMAAEAIGFRQGPATDGQTTVAAFRRTALSDWSVVLSRPQSEAFAPAWRVVGLWTALALALLAGSVWTARALWMRLAPPLEALGRSARRLQQGELPELPDSHIVEIDRLRDLLRDAAATEARSRSDALRRARAEESARAALEAAEAQALVQARLRAAVEHFPHGVVLYDATRRFEYLNGWALALLGRPAGDFIGRRDEDVWPASLTDVYLPTMQRAFDSRSVQTLEWTLPEDPFGGRTVAVTYAPLFDDDGSLAQVLAIIYDLTERRQAEAVRAESEAQLRRVLDNLDAFVAVLDLEGTLLEINRAPLERAGLQRADVLGLPFWECAWWDPAPAGRARLRDAVSQAAAGGSVRYDVAFRAAGDRWLMLDFQLAPLRDDAGTITHLIPSAVDVTERKQTEAALRAADRQKDEFLAILSHELRNPLAPIRSAAHVIKLRDPQDPIVARARDVIERQVNQLVRLVDDLLEVARITQGRIELRRRSESLADIVSAAVEGARPSIEACGHRLTVEVPTLPLTVFADAARLSQALLNLIHNAAKYTPDGGRIALRVVRAGTLAHLSVEDDGIGIAPDALASIFGMFVQGEHVASGAGGGLGIGLALARRLVEMHGGSIAAQSDGPGRGSTFSISLPLSEERGADASAAAAAAPAAASAAPPPARGIAVLSVLVVDDNADAASSLQAMLVLDGHSVRTAHSGAAALAAVAAERPDVLLLDIGLPDIDGNDLARRLRADYGPACPRLIALSGWGRADDKRRAREAGFERHFTKPVEPSAIALALAEGATDGGWRD